jgi:hypothetical protein
MQCTMQMQCTLTLDQMNAVKMWTMDEYCRLGGEAEKQKGEPKLCVKKKPWWPFITVTHYMVPLLHCEIGIGNQLLDTLRDIINEHLDNMTRTEERMRKLIPLLNNIISETAKKRDAYDASDDGKLRKNSNATARCVPSLHHQKTLQTTMPPSLSTSHQPPPPTPTLRQKKIN